ncbi:conserved hypothetical protein [Acidithiobacillus caldus SM-1]|uniref:Uncharacterized protein n=1 Tax=Acidithiobacillus caldus (strain SM-1) TaxID=990288 RepID=F9ZQ56_ACICS|nr:conserved hypothetical protein [Acidithiobacillus caldus SM-1]
MMDISMNGEIVFVNRDDFSGHPAGL